MTGLLLRIREILDRFFMVIAGVALVALMLLAAGNVILRLFGVPFSGTVELVGFLGVLVIGFALGETQRRKDHVVVDIVSKRYPPWLAMAADALQLVVSAAFFALIAWQVAAWGMSVRRSGELSETLKIVYYPLAFCLSASLWLLSFNLLVDLAVRLSARAAGKPAE
jgi:TRAP-type C4-dicarboxylate transport system permease small subunit